MRATVTTRPTVGRLTRIGAVFFILWGVLHMAVAVTGVVGYLQNGPAGLLSVFGAATVSTPTGGIVGLAAAVGLDLAIDLAAFATLGVWVGVMIWRGQRQQLAFWLGAIILGTADLAFVVALVIPGYIGLVNGLSGPVLYVLAVAFTAAGLLSISTRAQGAAPVTVAQPSAVRP